MMEPGMSSQVVNDPNAAGTSVLGQLPIRRATPKKMGLWDLVWESGSAKWSF
jgi:hypothetical protein